MDTVYAQEKRKLAMQGNFRWSNRWKWFISLLQLMVYAR